MGRGRFSTRPVGLGEPAGRLGEIPVAIEFTRKSPDSQTMAQWRIYASILISLYKSPPANAEVFIASLSTLCSAYRVIFRNKPPCASRLPMHRVVYHYDAAPIPRARPGGECHRACRPCKCKCDGTRWVCWANFCERGAALVGYITVFEGVVMSRRLACVSGCLPGSDVERAGALCCVSSRDRKILKCAGACGDCERQCRVFVHAGLTARRSGFRAGCV